MNTVDSGAIDNFNNILGKSSFNNSDIKTIISYLSNTKESEDKFTNWVKKLKSLDFAPIKPKKKNNLKSGSVKMNELPGGENIIYSVGQGAYGTVYKGTKISYSYKSIEPKEDITSDSNMLENFYRKIFLETWIQTILSSDRKYGDNICKPLHLKRSSSTPGLFIIMEYVPLSCNDFLKEKIDKNKYKKITLKDTREFFIKLITILDHFKTQYGFFHRDLHIHNIRLTSEYSIKFIDLGMACITANNTNDSITVFSMQKKGISFDLAKRMDSKNVTCASFDLLMFFTFFYQHYCQTMKTDIELAIFIRLLFITKTDTVFFDLLNYLTKFLSKNWRHLHFTTYPEHLQEIYISLDEKNKNSLDNFKTDKLLIFLSSVENFFNDRSLIILKLLSIKDNPESLSRYYPNGTINYIHDTSSLLHVDIPYISEMRFNSDHRFLGYYWKGPPNKDNMNLVKEQSDKFECGLIGHLFLTAKDSKKDPYIVIDNILKDKVPKDYFNTLLSFKGNGGGRSKTRKIRKQPVRTEVKYSQRG